MKWIFLLILCLAFCHCHGNKEKSAALKRLDADITELEKEVADLEEKTKGTGTSDPGKHANLLQQKELVKSRLSRLKQMRGDKGGGEKGGE